MKLNKTPPTKIPLKNPTSYSSFAPKGGIAFIVESAIFSLTFMI